MKITPRKLILDLLLASDDLPLSAREAVAACGLFEIGATSVRVALTRLLNEGLIRTVERGVYQLGPNALELAGEIAAWRSIDRHARAWAGDYITVFTATLGRVDRSALARRERALKIFGFAELEKGLYIRPNNLNLELPALIEKLRKIGVESEAIIAQANGYSPEIEQRIQALWDGKALNKRYQSITKTLEIWMSRAATLPLEAAARESFLLGGSAIHQVVFDPLLPAPLVDTVARDAFIDLVLRFDQFGKDIWTQLREAGFMASDVVAGATPA